MSEQSLFPPLDHPTLRFFPVRHHSPVCARMLNALIESWQPDLLLVEGPSDFNDQLDNFFLPHQLPIAIYSYVHLESDLGELRRGAFYPFCSYSPEWQGMQSAHKAGADVAFIDLPWADMAEDAREDHRYADAGLTHNDYIFQLCRELGVETFDQLWDTLFEIPEEWTVESFLTRTHTFFYHMRTLAGDFNPVDVRREAFMEAQIRAGLKTHQKVLVVTGGFHMQALWERLKREAPWQEDALKNRVPEPVSQSSESQIRDQGISLTPYTYQRLDALAGYEAGMPSPGFYHQTWVDKQQQNSMPSHRQLLGKTAELLRKEGQIVSAADLIAVETTAQSLADLRGHSRIWRQDIIDGILGALVKDELSYGLPHPFLTAVYTLFSGNARGRLAAGTRLPTLVTQIQKILAAHDLLAESRRKITIDLSKPEDLKRSRILHQIRMLALPGYARTNGSQLTGSKPSEQLWESWSLVWSPEFEAASIEAAIYGGTLEDASRTKLLETAVNLKKPNAATAAILLRDAALMGLPDTTDQIYAQLQSIIQQDNDFFNVAQALRHLLYLYRFDQFLGSARNLHVGTLLQESFQRSLWLLEGFGSFQGRDQDLIESMNAIWQTWLRSRAILAVAEADLAALLSRISEDQMQTAVARGGATGMLWNLGTATDVALQKRLRSFNQPEHLGDFLAGLFALARETVKQLPELMDQIDQFVSGYDNEAFLTSLPALRLAFSYFTPREKHTIASAIFPEVTETGVAPVELIVDALTAAKVMAFETSLFAAWEKYGLQLPKVKEANDD